MSIYMYDLDFKDFTLEMYNNRKKFNISINDLLKLSKISRSTLYSWVGSFNKKVNIIDNQNNKFNISINKKSKFSDECKECILNIALKRSYLNVNNIIKKIKKEYSTTICKSSIYNILKNNNITFKKIQKRT